MACITILTIFYTCEFATIFSFVFIVEGRATTKTGKGILGENIFSFKT